MSHKHLISIGSCFGADEYFRDMVSRSITLYNPLQAHNHIDENSIVIFGGGEDISPILYKKKLAKNVNCSAPDFPSYRDQMEKETFDICRRRGAYVLGICRGAQLVCALSGGSLYQHVNGHHRPHVIETDDNQALVTSSVHHQMMNLEGIKEYKLIAWAVPRRSDIYVVDDKTTLSVEEKDKNLPEKEPEVVFFTKERALGIQGHPEFMKKNTQFVLYCRGLFEEYLL